MFGKKILSECIIKYKLNDPWDVVNLLEKKISEKTFTREELGLPKEGFVFCCFNQMIKLSPEIFDIWMNLLKSINNI